MQKSFGVQNFKAAAVHLKSNACQIKAGRRTVMDLSAMEFVTGNFGTLCLIVLLALIVLPSVFGISLGIAEMYLKIMTQMIEVRREAVFAALGSLY